MNVLVLKVINVLDNRKNTACSAEFFYGAPTQYMSHSVVAERMAHGPHKEINK